MKKIFLLLIIIPFLLQCQSIKKMRCITPPKYFGKYYICKKNQENFLKRFTHDTICEAPRCERTIKTKKQAIKLVEPFLFKKYGVEETKHERPYQVFYIKGYWVVLGTLSRRFSGGTSNTFVNAKTGEIEFSVHTK